MLILNYGKLLKHHHIRLLLENYNSYYIIIFKDLATLP